MKIKYSSDSGVGCSAAIVVIAIVLGLAFAGDVILTKIVIWIVDSLFDCDWSDKFWQVFVALLIIPMIFNLKVKVGKND